MASLLLMSTIISTPLSSGISGKLPYPETGSNHHYQEQLKRSLPDRWEYSTDGVKWQPYRIGKALFDKLFYLRTRTSGKEWIGKLGVADYRVQIKLTLTYLGRYVVDLSLNHTFPRGLVLEKALAEARHVSEKQVLTDRFREREYNIYLSVLRHEPSLSTGKKTLDPKEWYLAISDAILIFDK